MKQIGDVNLYLYNEEEAIKALDKNLTIASERVCRSLDSGDLITSDQIMIIVNGIVHAFYIGVPQLTAMDCFIRNICVENGYEYPEAVK